MINYLLTACDNVMRALGDGDGRMPDMSVRQIDVSGERALVITLPETQSLAVQYLLKLGSHM